MSNLYIALVHYPVLNKNGEIITTSVTNLDIHDIARCAKTYSLKRFYIITPDSIQQSYIERIKQFWKTNQGMMYNPERSKALETLEVCKTIEQTIELISTQEKMQPVIITTTAKQMDKQISYNGIRTLLNTTQPVLILFGTGYGLAQVVHNCSDFILSPIQGRDGYNHLSVRSATAIILDRIFSEEYRRNHGYSATNWQSPNQNRLTRISRRRYGKSPL